MKIICLFGKADSGKTTTLKMVFDLLKDKLDVLADLSEGNDITIVLSDEKKKIAIISAGDSEDDLKKGFNAVTVFAPELVICAARSKGETRKFVYEQSDDILMLSKSYLEIKGNGVSGKSDEFCREINYQTAIYIVEEILKSI